ncbi:N-acetylmuramoyl-L-alanine amidase family protein [Paenibacillus arenilitoris]|uniref:N-acetylmuramoyl-L-alanine amidase n=1 Tax=Paenibacillus arenilitoris TaxID=2772299 RepID=A0A927CQU0_9BACL|nr:N-acetylmuramoyl-L-alanine amidase [Paenibacillus arenilitoris]MBD2871417.1 N-acetylmuramoyl-L-alanine amidase [Paenibacillus arenilitoris]
MAKLIAICDGHGMETAGKRTPMLPDGSFMRENEFNRAVAAMLDTHLRRCGFRTLPVAPTDADTPLHARIRLANTAGADFYISIHANAFGIGGWNGARGTETYYYTGSAEGRKAAEIIHRHLTGGTPLPNRGVKTSGSFAVLRDTVMPAVLVECAFMTNREDAALLLSGAYRAECAEELARGLCEYFNVPYIVEEAEVEEPGEVSGPMTAEDANKIIRFLSAAYMATDVPEARKEFNRLANELRIASGQPTQ